MGDDKKMVVLGGKRDSLPLIAPRQGRTHKSKWFLLKASGLKEGGIYDFLSGMYHPKLSLFDFAPKEISENDMRSCFRSLCYK